MTEMLCPGADNPFFQQPQTKRTKRYVGVHILLAMKCIYLIVRNSLQFFKHFKCNNGHSDAVALPLDPSFMLSDNWQEYKLADVGVAFLVFLSLSQELYYIMSSSKSQDEDNSFWRSVHSSYSCGWQSDIESQTSVLAPCLTKTLNHPPS